MVSVRARAATAGPPRGSLFEAEKIERGRATLRPLEGRRVTAIRGHREPSGNHVHSTVEG
jgi:hypothetical protein